MNEYRKARPVLLLGLTGLRGVGALWVLSFHAQYGMNIPVADGGYLGVDLFFILSGFVLSHAHPDIDWDFPTYARFLRSRFARIFPLHWFALAMVLLIVTVYPRIRHDLPHLFQWPGLIASIPLMQNWGWGQPAPWNGPAWSLSTEWLVSLAFPLFLVSARRIRRPALAACLCGGCLVAFALFLMATHNPNPGVLGRAGVVRTVCDFAAGCLLYRIYVHGARVHAFAAMGGGLLLAGGLLVPHYAILAVFSFPLIVLLATQPSGQVSKFLSSRPMVFLGEISFSIYLLHWILIIASDDLQYSLHIHGFAAFLWFCGYFALVIALSTTTYHLVEVPARRWLRGAKTAPVPGIRTDDPEPRGALRAHPVRGTRPSIG